MFRRAKKPTFSQREHSGIEVSFGECSLLFRFSFQFQMQIPLCFRQFFFSLHSQIQFVKQFTQAFFSRLVHFFLFISLYLALRKCLFIRIFHSRIFTPNKRGKEKKCVNLCAMSTVFLKFSIFFQPLFTDIPMFLL